MTKPSKAKQKAIRELLTRGVADVVYSGHLEKALGKGNLRVKLGIDPTAPDLHLGHAVVLRKLRQFQNLGNKAVLIIGDFTGRIGDPSGRSKERPHLTEGEVKKNMKKYLAQAGKILDMKKSKLEIRYNSEWLGKSVEDILELARAGSVQQILKRTDFKTRISEGHTITLLETFYPLLQGYDSVNVEADVEIGGTDQLLNLLTGRQVQRYFGKPEQDTITMSLLVGTDGTKKMSKSANNYIALDDSPEEMFGKIMSIKDKLIKEYFLLCTDLGDGEIETIDYRIRRRELNPRDAKARLAYEIVKLYHGEETAGSAEAEFNRVFQKKKLPTRIPVKKIKKQSIVLDELIVAVGGAKSKSEAKRLVNQGAVRLDYAHTRDPKEKIKIPKNGILLQVGKRKFVRVKT